MKKKIASMRGRLRRQRGRKNKRTGRRTKRKAAFKKFSHSKLGKTLGGIARGVGGFALGGPMGAAAALGGPAMFKGIKKRRKRRLR